MTAVEVRPLRTGDCEEVGALLRDAYESRLHPYLVYCQKGIAAYLRDGIEYGFLSSGRTSTVAISGSTVVGYAEWGATGPRTHHLSHLCVALDARRSGIGRTLMREHLGTVDPEDAEVTLDVFTHNDPAVRMYERLGLRPAAHVSTWVRAELDCEVEEESHSLEIGDAVGAVASLQRYGFGVLSGRAASVDFRVGLIGTTVRLEEAAQLGRPSLVGALKVAIPSLKELLYIAGPEEPVPHAGDVILRSVRMNGPAAEIRKALG